MKKFKISINVDAMENWLNKQLQQGYRCTKINGLGIYTFEETDEDYVIRLDCQKHFKKESFADYQLMYEDFGWELLWGSRFGYIHYWQKKAGNHNEMYSDRQSLSKYYKRVMIYSMFFMPLLLYICIDMYTDGFYLTQGLWEMNGSLFWKALLFETPFVLLRLTPALILVLLGVGVCKACRQLWRLNQGQKG